MTSGERDRADLARVVNEAIALAPIESAVIFARMPGSSDLELAAAAGIDGVPLDRLRDAVRNPEHPIARTLADASPVFDVQPTAPGGPALRSHLPLAALGDGGPAVGVLAVAHDPGLDNESRHALERLAASAGRVLSTHAMSSDGIRSPIHRSPRTGGKR
jgi:hypothetical protein